MVFLLTCQLKNHVGLNAGGVCDINVHKKTLSAVIASIPPHGAGFFLKEQLIGISVAQSGIGY